MASNGRTNGITTALLYTRVSTDEQAKEGLSLPAQLADTRRYAAQSGWVIGAEHQDVLSGTRDDRPQYRRLLAEIRQLRAEGRSVAVVVKWLDRFGRSVRERAQAADELRALGVPIHSVMEGGAVSDFVYNILAAVAQEESRRLGERVAEVRQHAIANGWHFPGRVTWGYRWRERTDEEKAQGAPKAVLDVDPPTASFLGEAFCRVGEGESIRKVTRWVASLPAEARGGRRLNYEAMRRILTASVYIARLDVGEPDVLSRPRGRWPALVDDATFARVRERIASHARLPHQASGRHLLTGFIRCPRCGLRMTGGPHRGHSDRYTCNSKTYGAAALDLTCQHTVVAPAVDAAVLAEVGRLLGAVVDMAPGLEGAVRRAWQAQANPVDDITQRTQYLERLSERIRQRLTTAARKLVDGELDKAGYDLLRDEARSDLDAAEEELARLRARTPLPALPSVDVVLQEVGGWSQALQGADVPAQRDMLALVVDRVVPVRQSRGKYTVEITWTPLGETLRQLAQLSSGALEQAGSE